LKIRVKISFIQLLLSLCSLSFLLLVLTLSYYNRFAVDDYHYISHLRNLGVWGSMQYDYTFWGGRWATNLLWSIVYCNYQHSFVLVLFTFSNIIFLVASLFFLLRNIPVLVNIKFSSKLTLLNYCAITVMFVFLISPSKGEIWLWAASGFTYLLSISCFLCGFAMVTARKNNIFSYLLMVLCFIYTGGASEVYAITCVFILLFSLLFISKTKNPNISASRKSFLIKCCIALIFLLIAWIISIVAPGNSERASKLPEASVIGTFYMAFSALGKLILYKILPLSPWIIPFSLISIYLGYLNGNEEKKIDWKNYLKKFLYSSILLLFIVYCLLYISCYSLSDMAPDRSLSQILFMIVLFITGWLFFLGYKCIKNAKILSYCFYISTLFIIISLIELTVRQQKIMSAYATATDQRKEYLLDLEKAGNKKVITVKPLPSSGFLYSAEVTEDTLNYRNEHYEDGLGLNYKIKKGK